MTSNEFDRENNELGETAGHHRNPEEFSEVREHELDQEHEHEHEHHHSMLIQDKDGPATENRVLESEITHFMYAGFWMRFWAYLLDLIVIGSVTRMIINPVFRALDVSLVEDGIISPIAVATAVVFYLYFVLMTKFFGQTLGKMVFGLRVIDLGGKSLSWGTVLFREWIGRFISATVIVLYIVVAFTQKKQGLHDLFADTSVIHEPR